MARTFVSASSQYLERTAAVLTDYPVTIAVWVRPATVDIVQTPVALSQSGGTARCLMQISGTNNITAFNAATGGGASGFSSSTGTVSANTWHHGAAVFTSATSRTAYLDGVAGTPETTNVAIAGMDRTNIGARYNTTIGAYMNGDLAEAAMWNVALTAGEIASLAKGLAPIAVRIDSLVAYWPLIGRASPEYDVVGGFAMTLTNTPTTGAHPRIYYPRSGSR
jgi:hypothetical protein